MVYEGLLPYTQNEASLAIVLGHEIAHAVAKHSAEQMSTQIRNQYGTQILGGVLEAAGVSSTTTQLAQILTQKGLQFRSLKYSRNHETEADRMGLILPPWLVTIPAWPWPFGSVWRKAMATATRAICLATTPLMLSALLPSRPSCLRR